MDKSSIDKNVFCLAPWIHSYISPQGLRQLCCVADHNFGINKSLNEMWNSDEMKNIRLQMLNNEKLQICNRCDGGALNPNTYRNYFTKNYEHLIDDILENTQKDGTYEKLPITFDYRTNVCNFKCKICTEEFSSQIHSEKQTNNLELLYGILSSKEREDSFKIIDTELENEEILKNVSEFYWAGGEPMYWKRHWKTLQKLIDNGQSKNVKLRYSTNLSTIEHNGKLLIDYFDHFKKIEIFCSLDATESIGEWIRSNLNYSKWKENFSKLVEYKNQRNHVEVYLAVTVTTSGLFDFENLYELCKEFNISPDFQTCYSLVATNLLSPKSFPKKIVQSIIENFLNNHVNDDNYIIEKFRNYSSFLLSQEFFETQNSYEHNLIEGLKSIKYLDENRPHSVLTFEKIIQQNKELYDFYKEKKLINKI